MSSSIGDVSPNGASAVIYYDSNGKIYILVGKESNYLYEKELLTPEQISEIIKRQKFTPVLSKSKSPSEKSSLKNEKNLNSAKRFFQRGAEELEKILNIPEVRYDEAIYNDADQTYETIYRYLVENPKLGIIKGKKNVDENTLDTIYREMKEEVGIVVNKSSLNLYSNLACKKYDCYKLLVSSDDKVSHFKTTIIDRKKKHRGEMFELEFKELSEIKNLLNAQRFNIITACAINLFLGTKGGKKKRRTQKKRRRGSRRK